MCSFIYIDLLYTFLNYFRKYYGFCTEALEGHFYLLLITYYLLLITYHLLLTTYHLLLTTYYLSYHLSPLKRRENPLYIPEITVAVVVVVVVVVYV